MLVPAGGPKTEQGKEVVRWNATQALHPRWSLAWRNPKTGRNTVRESCRAYSRALLEAAPRHPLRDTDYIALSQEHIEEAIRERRRFVLAFRNGSINTHPEDIRLQAKHDKKAHSALRRFPSHGDDKTVNPEDATSVVWGVLMAVQKGIEEERMYDPCTYPYLTS